MKNLRKIIHGNISYYDYKNIQKIYTITNWDRLNSPVNNLITGNNNNSNNQITNSKHLKEMDNNPYIKMLYVNYE